MGQRRRSRGNDSERHRRNVHRSLALVSRAAGIEPAFSGYDLRKTTITHQEERGMPVHEIADWAGTSERMIWEVYRKQLQEVADLAPVDLGHPDR